MKLDKNNVKIEKDNKYYRVYIKYDTHKLHSEKLNLETAIRVRDELIQNQ